MSRMINETIETERAYHKGLSEEYYRGYRTTKDEIVHCEDCKYFEGKKDVTWCNHQNAMVHPTPDGFCSYGERKE